MMEMRFIVIIAKWHTHLFLENETIQRPASRAQILLCKRIHSEAHLWAQRSRGMAGFT